MDGLAKKSCIYHYFFFPIVQLNSLPSQVDLDCVREGKLRVFLFLLGFISNFFGVFINYYIISCT